MPAVYYNSEGTLEYYVPPPPPPPPPPPNVDTPHFEHVLHVATQATTTCAANPTTANKTTFLNDWNVVGEIIANQYRLAWTSRDPKAAVAALDRQYAHIFENSNGPAATVYSQVAACARGEVQHETTGVRKAEIALYNAMGEPDSSKTKAIDVVQADINVQLQRKFGNGNNGVYTVKEINAAAAAAGSDFGPAGAQLVSLVATGMEQGQTLDTLLTVLQTPGLKLTPKEIKSGNLGAILTPEEIKSGALILTPAQAQLFEADPFSLALVMTAGLTVPQLSPQMAQLAKESPYLFFFAVANHINISIPAECVPPISGHAPVKPSDPAVFHLDNSSSVLDITIDGKPITLNQLPAGEFPSDVVGLYDGAEATSTGSGVIDLATLLLSDSNLHLTVTPATLTNPGNLQLANLSSLLTYADGARSQYATGQLASLLAAAPKDPSSKAAAAYIANVINPFLTTQLNGFFNLGTQDPQKAQTAFWATSPAILTLRDYLGKGLAAQFQPGNPNSLNIAGIYLGDVLPGASSCEAKMLISLLEGQVNGLKPFQPEGFAPPDPMLLNALSQAAQVADGLPLGPLAPGVQPGPEADQLATWLLNTTQRGVPILGRWVANDLFYNITSTGNTDLPSALVDAWSSSGKYVYGTNGSTPVELGNVIDWTNDAEGDYATALQKQLGAVDYNAFENNKAETLAIFRDEFSKVPNIGKKVSTSDTTALRKAIIAAYGFTPAQLAPTASGPSQQTDIVNIDLSWIQSQSAPNATVTILPFIYASLAVGTQSGVFFDISNPDDRNNSQQRYPAQVLIDGSAAQYALQADPNAYEHPESVDVKWHYSSYLDFQLNNETYQGGTLYTLLSNPLGIKSDGSASSATDFHKEFDTVMDDVAGGAAVVGGVLLIPFTDGGSLILAGAGLSLTGLSLGWGTYQAFSEYHDYASHGEQFTWSNPNTRWDIVGDAMLAANWATLGVGGVAGGFTGAADRFGQMADTLTYLSDYRSAMGAWQEGDAAEGFTAAATEGDAIPAGDGDALPDGDEVPAAGEGTENRVSATLSDPAVIPALRTLETVNSGIATGLNWTKTGLEFLGYGLGGVQTVVSTYSLAANWNKMSGSEQALDVLNIGEGILPFFMEPIISAITELTAGRNATAGPRNTDEPTPPATRSPFAPANFDAVETTDPEGATEDPAAAAASAVPPHGPDGGAGATGGADETPLFRLSTVWTVIQKEFGLWTKIPRAAQVLLPEDARALLPQDTQDAATGISELSDDARALLPQNTQDAVAWIAGLSDDARDAVRILAAQLLDSLASARLKLEAQHLVFESGTDLSSKDFADFLASYLTGDLHLEPGSIQAAIGEIFSEMGPAAFYRAYFQGGREALDTLIDTASDVPGLTIKPSGILVVVAHPDDETNMAAVIMQAFEAGRKVDILYATRGENASTYKQNRILKILMPWSDPRTGKEVRNRAEVGEQRMQEPAEFIRALGGNADNVTIRFMKNPDASPFDFPGQRSVYYPQLARWDVETIKDTIKDLMANNRYEAVFTMTDDPAVHPAHQGISTITAQTIDEFYSAGAPEDLTTTISADDVPAESAATTGDEGRINKPHLVMVREVGYYPKLTKLRPTELDPESGARRVVFASDVVSSRLLDGLRQAFGRAPDEGSSDANTTPPRFYTELGLSESQFSEKKRALDASYKSQPPSNSSFGQDRLYEAYEGTREAIRWLEEFRNPTPSETWTPVTSDSPPTMLETIEYDPNNEQPRRVGAGQLEPVYRKPSLPDELQDRSRDDWQETRNDYLASFGDISNVREAPRSPSDYDEAVYDHLRNAPENYDPPLRVWSLKDWQRRFSLIRPSHGEGGFFTGPDKNIVVWFSSSRPVDKGLGEEGLSLGADNTVASPSFNGALSHAARSLADPTVSPDTLHYLYRWVGPARVWLEGYKSKHWGADGFEGALVAYKADEASRSAGGQVVYATDSGEPVVLLSFKGALNPDTKYAPEPGEVYGAPRSVGMSRGRTVLRTSGAVIGAGGFSFLAYHFGLFGITGSLITVAGSLALGIRGAINGLMDIGRIRLASNIDDVREAWKQPEITFDVFDKLDNLNKKINELGVTGPHDAQIKQKAVDDAWIAVESAQTDVLDAKIGDLATARDDVAARIRERDEATSGGVRSRAQKAVDVAVKAGTEARKAVRDAQTDLDKTRQRNIPAMRTALDKAQKLSVGAEAAIDRVEKKFSGSLGWLSGIPRQDRDQYKVAIAILRNNPIDMLLADDSAINQIEGAIGKVVSPESALGRAWNVIQAASFVFNHLSGLAHLTTAGAFGVPRLAKASVADVATELSKDSDSAATAGLAPVYATININAVLSLGETAQSPDRNYTIADPSVQRVGARSRGDFKSRAWSFILGLGNPRSVADNGEAPDGRPIQKPSPAKWISWGQWALISVAAVPFTGYHLFTLVAALASGHWELAIKTTLEVGLDLSWRAGAAELARDAARDLKGLAPNVRRTKIPGLGWLNAPLGDAEVYNKDLTQQDMTKSRLVTGYGLKTLPPKVLYGLPVFAVVMMMIL